MRSHTLNTGHFPWGPQSQSTHTAGGKNNHSSLWTPSLHRHIHTLTNTPYIPDSFMQTCIIVGHSLEEQHTSQMPHTLKKALRETSNTYIQKHHIKTSHYVLTSYMCSQVSSLQGKTFHVFALLYARLMLLEFSKPKGFHNSVAHEEQMFVFLIGVFFDCCATTFYKFSFREITFASFVKIHKNLPLRSLVYW